MKAFLPLIAVLSLASIAASAQERDHDGPRGGGRGQGGGGAPAAPQGGGWRGAAPQGAPQGAPPAMAQPQRGQNWSQPQMTAPPQAQRQPQAYGQPQPYRQPQGEGWRPQGADQRGPGDRGRQDWNRGREDWNRGREDGDRGRGEWNRGHEDWNRGRNDWNRGGGPAFYGARGSRDAHWSYQGAWRPSYHARPFYYPSGWGYRRWIIGEYLPPLFFGSEFFIGDFYDYGLPPPPWGCRWVRYGPDALLIDLRTGSVVEAIYGIFWW